MPRKNPGDEFNQHDRRKETPLAMTIVEEPGARTVIDRDLSHQMLGAAKYASYIQGQAKSDIVRFLILVRDEKRYLDFGMQNFDDFLESEFSQLTRPTFYRELDLYNNEGEQYDLFNEWKIPARVRKQLTSGDISIDGDEVVVGEERVSITQGGSIKAILEQLVKEKIAATKTADEAVDKLERTERRLKAEQSTVDDLRAAIDRFNEKTPFQIAFGDLFAAASILADFVANELDPEDRERRAEQDCKALEVILNDVKEAYGIAKWQTMLHEADKKAAAAGGGK